jgi:D-xylose transport system substrate-binding protein
MFQRRVIGLLGAAAIVFAACTGGGTTTTASPSGPAASPSAGGASPSGSAAAGECTVGVSWNNFQQPRWAATDKPNMQQTIEDGGGTFIDADANLDSVQQLTDVDNLISQGAQVLVLLAQDQNAILPAVTKAKDEGIPVIAYDRLIEDPEILYITFDNVGVGRAEAEAVLEEVPTGNYVLIKGDPGDPNASTFLPQGWDEAGLADKVESGDITLLNGPDGTFTDAWDTQTAQNNMEAIIDKANADGNTIDAVLAENDSTALGVAAALVGKNYDPYPPLSGQDGDPANLNNVAKGLQYVDVWKNSNELGKAAGAAALALCANPDIASVTLPDGLIDPDVAPEAGLAVADFETPGGNTVKSLILQPTPITAENLDLVIDGGWIDQETLCEGVEAGDPGESVCQ